MADGTEKADVNSAQSREHARVQFVVLAVAFIDQSYLAGIGHDYLVAQTLQQPTYPRRVRAGFYHDARRCSPESQRESFLGCADPILLNDVTPPVQDAVPAPAVTEVDTDRDL